MSSLAAKTLRLLLLVRTPPYADWRAQEALDVALTASILEQEVCLLYMDDAVYQLLDRQQAHLLQRNSANAPVAGLRFYDIRQIFVCAESLAERGLALAHLSAEIEPQALDGAALKKLMAAQDQILSL